MELIDNIPDRPCGYDILSSKELNAYADTMALKADGIGSSGIVKISGVAGSGKTTTIIKNIILKHIMAMESVSVATLSNRLVIELHGKINDLKRTYFDEARIQVPEVIMFTNEMLFNEGHICYYCLKDLDNENKNYETIYLKTPRDIYGFFKRNNIHLLMIDEANRLKSKEIEKLYKVQTEAQENNYNLLIVLAYDNGQLGAYYDKKEYGDIDPEWDKPDLFFPVSYRCEDETINQWYNKQSSQLNELEYYLNYNGIETYYDLDSDIGFEIENREDITGKIDVSEKQLPNDNIQLNNKTDKSFLGTIFEYASPWKQNVLILHPTNKGVTALTKAYADYNDVNTILSDIPGETKDKKPLPKSKNKYVYIKDPSQLQENKFYWTPGKLGYMLKGEFHILVPPKGYMQFIEKAGINPFSILDKYPGESFAGAVDSKLDDPTEKQLNEEPQYWFRTINGIIRIPESSVKYISPSIAETYFSAQGCETWLLGIVLPAGSNLTQIHKLVAFTRAYMGGLKDNEHPYGKGRILLYCPYFKWNALNKGMLNKKGQAVGKSIGQNIGKSIGKAKGKAIGKAKGKVLEDFNIQLKDDNKKNFLILQRNDIKLILNDKLQDEYDKGKLTERQITGRISKLLPNYKYDKKDKCWYYGGNDPEHFWKTTRSIIHKISNMIKKYNELPRYFLIWYIGSACQDYFDQELLFSYTCDQLQVEEEDIERYADRFFNNNDNYEINKQSNKTIHLPEWDKLEELPEETLQLDINQLPRFVPMKNGLPWINKEHHINFMNYNPQYMTTYWAEDLKDTWKIVLDLDSKERVKEFKDLIDKTSSWISNDYSSAHIEFATNKQIKTKHGDKIDLLGNASGHQLQIHKPNKKRNDKDIIILTEDIYQRIKQSFD